MCETEPATRTFAFPATSRARSAACTLARLIISNRSAKPTAQSINGEVANEFTEIISPRGDIVAMHRFKRLAMLQRDGATPGVRIHRHPAALQLRAGPAIKDDEMSVGEFSVEVGVGHQFPPKATYFSVP